MSKISASTSSWDLSSCKFRRLHLQPGYQLSITYAIPFFFSFVFQPRCSSFFITYNPPAVKGFQFYSTECIVGLEILRRRPNPRDGGEGGTQKSFIRGGSAPRSNPLPFYIPFFFRKGTPFVYPLLGKGTPFRRLMNKSLKQEVFLSFFSRSAYIIN